jgi:HK97 family phage portal protein
MSLISAFTNLFSSTVVGETNTEVNRITDYLNFPNVNFNLALGESISSVYTSCKILSDDVGSFPINVYQNADEGDKSILKDDYRYSLLHFNPNNYTTSHSFFAALEYIRNIRGNSFARINRNLDGSVKSLSIISPHKILSYKLISDELYYLFKEDDNSPEQWINASEFLHFRTLTTDGIWGVNPIEKLRLNLSTTYKAFTTIDRFYDNNATSPKALKTSIPEGINPKEWQTKVEDFQNKYGGFKNAGKIISLPPFTELQDITLSFADAEFIATIRFNADQIAALYKVPPHMLGNFESSKFNNLEQLQLNYKINTLRPILRMYRQELEFKLLTNDERVNGMSVEFNSNAIVETDSKTRIENYKNLFGMGAITPNDIAKYEGTQTYDGGDNHFVMTNLMSVESYNKKNAVQPPSQPLDSPQL